MILIHMSSLSFDRICYDVFQLKLLVPRYASENASVWVYPVTFGGGLVGGDRVHMTFTAKSRCCLVLTGQESTKVSVVALLFHGLYLFWLF